MLHIQRICSIDDPLLKPYRTMRRHAEHRQQGIFVAEGEKVARRLLESSFPVLSVLLEEKWFRDFEPLLQKRTDDIMVYIAEKRELEKLTGYPLYQGALAVGRIPAPPSLDSLLEKSPRPWLMAAMEGITNAQNIGIIVRTCAAFGVHVLLVGETSCSPFLRRAVRNSMGAILHQPVVEVENLAETLKSLQGRGIPCIAAHPHAHGKTIFQTNFRRDCCLVFGSEGFGLSSPVLKACDEVVMVPMGAQMDSLNVGSAASIFLYEAARQRSGS